MTARVLAWISSLIGFAGVALYLVVINNQDDGIDTEAWLWAGCFAVPAACALVGAVSSRAHLRRTALFGAGTVFVGLGFLGLFSVGIVFVVAGFCALFAGALIAPERMMVG